MAYKSEWNHNEIQVTVIIQASVTVTVTVTVTREVNISKDIVLLQQELLKGEIAEKKEIHVAFTWRLLINGEEQAEHD